LASIHCVCSRAVSVLPLCAPFTPFFADRLYQDLDGAKMSVHLDRWPKPDERLIDGTLLADMEWARAVVTKGLEARATAKIPVRQALASLTVRFRDAAEATRLEARHELTALIRDELNVEKVLLESGTRGMDEADVWAVTLDTVITPELRKKGMARELVRHFMSLRKAAGLQPNDRIHASAATEDPGLRDILDGVKESVAKDLRADSLAVGAEMASGMTNTADIALDGKPVVIALKKA